MKKKVTAIHFNTFLNKKNEKKGEFLGLDKGFESMGDAVCFHVD